MSYAEISLLSYQRIFRDHLTVAPSQGKTIPNPVQRSAPAPRSALLPETLQPLIPSPPTHIIPTSISLQTSHTHRIVSAEAQNGATAPSIPVPVVKIDNESDPFATIVTVEFGDYLGELLDTIAALKSLGLNIRRAKVKIGESSSNKSPNKFYITDSRTSEKVIKSARIEEIRLTILNMMLKYHPESGDALAWGSDKSREDIAPMPRGPLGVRPRPATTTSIEIRESEDGTHSEVMVNTTDRPGLLTDIVHVLKDISLNVVSAEVDTIGRIAVDKFNVTYQGEPLPATMAQLTINALQYYLSQAEVEKEWEESY
jgi:UTP:GlnB (protein PII) uridylyltransferase